MPARPSDEWRDWTGVELNGALVIAGMVLAALAYGPICIAYAGLRGVAAFFRAVFFRNVFAAQAANGIRSPEAQARRRLAKAHSLIATR